VTTSLRGGSTTSTSPFHERAVAPHRHLDPAADRAGDHESLDLGRRGHARPVDRHDDVAGAQAGDRGRAARDDVGHVQARAPAEARDQRRRERRLPTDDAQPRPAHTAVGEQRVDDAARRGVDRHGQPDADARHGRAHPDHPPGRVGEHAAAVAGVERGVGLDHLVHDAARPRGQGAAEPGDDARRDAAGQAERVADRDDELPDDEARRVPERHRGRQGCAGAQHGEVRQRVPPDDVGHHLGPVGERGGRPGRPRDDVRRREQHVRADDARAPRARAARRRDRQARDRGQHRARHARDDG
jgi:hypothetical protein